MLLRRRTRRANRAYVAYVAYGAYGNLTWDLRKGCTPTPMWRPGELLGLAPAVFVPESFPDVDVASTQGSTFGVPVVD